MLKEANVCPVPKKGDLSIVSNHRPISLLNAEAKVFERLVFKYLFNHLRDNNLLSSLQSGSIPGDSTVNQLTFLYNTFCQALNPVKRLGLSSVISAKHSIVYGMLVSCINLKQLVSQEKSLIGSNIIFRIESNVLLFLVLFLIGFLLELEFLKNLYLGLYYFIVY